MAVTSTLIIHGGKKAKANAKRGVGDGAKRE